MLLGHGIEASRVFLGSLSGVSEREQTWATSHCVAELLEFARVTSEGSVVPLVSLAVPWAFDRVHTSDVEYFALVSSVGCIGPGVCCVGQNKITTLSVASARSLQ